MKYLIPAAAILILGIYGSSRRSGEAAKPDRVVVGGIVQETELPGVPEIVRDSGSLLSRSAETSPATSGVPAAALSEAPRQIPASEIQEMLDVLGWELGLTGEQRPRVIEALKGRVQDLRGCHQAYRENGVFVPAEYGKQLARLKENWFRNIDGILDSGQHHRFVQLVNDGFFRPGTEFTVDLNTMTVLR